MHFRPNQSVQPETEEEIKRSFWIEIKTEVRQSRRLQLLCLGEGN